MHLTRGAAVAVGVRDPCQQPVTRASHPNVIRCAWPMRPRGRRRCRVQLCSATAARGREMTFRLSMRRTAVSERRRKDHERAYSPRQGHPAPNSPRGRARTRPGSAHDALRPVRRGVGRDLVYEDGQGVRRETSAEVHFGWVLEGRAIQDVWIAPALRAGTAASELMHGTTLRVYDPQQDLWQITWIIPFDRCTPA